MARPMLARFIATPANRPVWPVYKPTGKARTVATVTDTAEIHKCSQRRIGTPVEPCQLEGSENQAITSLIRPPSRGRSPRG